MGAPGGPPPPPTLRATNDKTRQIKHYCDVHLHCHAAQRSRLGQVTEVCEAKQPPRRPLWFRSQLQRE
jgi:hypothetical protein